MSSKIIKSILVGFLVFIILSLILYFQKTKRERDKEEKSSLALGSVVPALLVGILVAGLCSSGLKFPSFSFGNNRYLDEDFGD